MREIPKSHPRYLSLQTRNKISQAMKDGIVHETGLIAHGRGEAFDYLIDEKTQPFAEAAVEVTSAALLGAINPVISINGNVAALVAEDCIRLSELIPAKLEVNLFHRSKARIGKITNLLLEKGAKKIYGQNTNSKIPGLDHNRALCDKEGIYSADVVLVPLEDGDRCQALTKMNKTVIAIDLNPLSRTSRFANITIVDNVIRAIPNLNQRIEKDKYGNKKELQKKIEKWDNIKNLNETVRFISKRLNLQFY